MQSVWKQVEKVEMLIEHISKHDTVYYKAPLNTRPVRCRVVRYTVDHRKPGASCITIKGPDGTRFDRLRLAEHLDRFWWKTDVPDEPGR